MRHGLGKNSVWPRLEPNNSYGKHSQDWASHHSKHPQRTPSKARRLQPPSSHFSADFLRLTIAAIQVGAKGLVQPFDVG